MDIDNHATEEASSEENFAEMFEKSFKKQERLEPGQMVEAMIVKISYASTSPLVARYIAGEGMSRRKAISSEREPESRARPRPGTIAKPETTPTSVRTAVVRRWRMCGAARPRRTEIVQ